MNWDGQSHWPRLVVASGVALAVQAMTGSAWAGWAYWRQHR